MKFKMTLLAILLSLHSFGQEKPELRYADKIRIREAINISNRYGDKLWKGFSSVPFTIVLVTDSIEFLINHPDPSGDFILSGRDAILSTDIYYRKRVFAKNLLATFPAVNAVNCIVIGIPENTNRKLNSAEWIITLLHEHFHQYQQTYLDYFRSVESLALSGGDLTGMWMLNYPFPYDSLPVIKQYEQFTKALYETVTNLDSRHYKANLDKYFQERKKLKNLLPAAAYRYFSFQIWQEGLSRYTEYRYAQMLADYVPSKEVLLLPDFTSFTDVKEKMYHNETQNLLNNKINDARRVCFYSLGFAEGLILDKLNKSWRKRYLKDKFYIEKYSKKFEN